ncbi:methyl-accepting chemotaxis protein [Nitrospirillum viridazoti]|uniref:Methyl-accepting chemotaxis protein n=1 Tax=Nitrospirillum amazonense TaxID=28077 RepID=A0A560IYZ7_9PROT|nr:HAMP domain-containing methyl-accepting chemotaxis protein [Nitrospirillum amazonense]TWB64126.1 methyl-accepting chemotaxis protein [Nitrospirillum amazonense]
MVAVTTLPTIMRNTGPARAGKRRLGLAARLGLAFGAIILAMLVITGQSWLTYARVDSTLNGIVGETLPRLDTLDALSRAAEGLAGTSMDASIATTHEEAQATRKALTVAEKAFNDALRQANAQLGQTPQLEELRVLGGRFSALLQVLNGAEDARWRLRQAVTTSEKAAAEADARAQAALMTALGRSPSPAILSALAEMRAFNALLGAPATAGEDPAAAKAALANALQHLRTTQATLPADTRAIVTASLDMLTRMALGEAVPATPGFGDVTAGGLAVMKSRLADAQDQSTGLLHQSAAIAARVQKLGAELGAQTQAEVRTKAKALEDVVSFARGLLIASGLAGVAIAVGVAVFYVGRSIAGRVANLSRSMLALAGGDLGVEIDTRGSDEIAEMARTVTVFRANAVQVREHEVQLAAERRESAEKRQAAMSAMADSFEQSVGGIIAALVDAAAQMTALSQSMGQSADATAEQANTVAMSSEAASRNTQTVAGATEQLSLSVQEISGQLQQAISISQRANEEADGAADMVERLTGAAERIGSVTRLIDDIAGQTNLLALNATIEAARAAAAGKGFAVVASEVKSLAGQTSKATGDIAGEVAAVRSAVGAVVDSIRQIGGTIVQLSQVSSTIAAAVEEQNAATAEISRSISEAALGVEEVNSTIGRVHTAALSTGESAGQVRTSAQGLADQAARLDEAVRRFLDQVRATEAAA